MASRGVKQAQVSLFLKRFLIFKAYYLLMALLCLLKRVTFTGLRLLIQKMNNLWGCLLGRRGSFMDKAQMGCGQLTAARWSCHSLFHPTQALWNYVPAVPCLKISANLTETGLFSESMFSCGEMHFFLPLVSTTSS